MASDVDKLILQPENEANLSRMKKSARKEPKSPCKKQVVSSANKLFFFSVLPTLIPFILSLLRTAMTRISIAKRNNKKSLKRQTLLRDWIF